VEVVVVGACVVDVTAATKVDVVVATVEGGTAVVVAATVEGGTTVVTAGVGAEVVAVPPPHDASPSSRAVASVRGFIARST